MSVEVEPCLSQIDVDTEEDDRVKYRDQLEIVGSLARVNLETALPHYTALLLERARVIRKLVDNQEECNAVSRLVASWLLFAMSTRGQEWCPQTTISAIIINDVDHDISNK